jgi:predicted O-linked N-acetylglucosamine transferase (SPINDLY family)
MALPDAGLTLMARGLTDPALADSVRHRFREQGIDPSRLELLPPHTPLNNYLSQYRRIDIALDPLPYNGGTTSCDALWMGVPVLTLAGEHLCGRMGLSLLHSLGLDDWVAEDDDDYIARARSLSADRDALTILRAGLRERMRHSPLCDATKFTRALEDNYRRMQHMSERTDTQHP